MPRLGPPLLLAFASSLLGCDRSSEFEDCVYVDDPGLTPGGRVEKCPRSTFKGEEARAREIAGIVRRGESTVPGAFVRVEPWAGFQTGNPPPVSTLTDAVGVFGGLRAVGLRYDVLVNLGADATGHEDILVFRGVGGRYTEPSIEVDTPTRSRAWGGKIDVHLDAPVPAGHAVAFYVSGEKAIDVLGDLDAGLTVYGRDYITPATVHAVLYETALGLASAKAHGKVDVLADAGTAHVAAIHLAPIEVFAETTFAVSAPVGFAPTSVDVIIGFQRTSGARLMTVPVGVKVKMPVIPWAGYTYRMRAEHEGAVSDSGETFLDVFAATTTIELPTPPVALSPAAGGTPSTTEPLLASGEGVFEHLLVPEGEGPRIRVVSRQRDAALPDLATLGAKPAVGNYTWTVRSFPALDFTEQLSGVDSRRFRAMGASAPRSIVLR